MKLNQIPNFRVEDFPTEIEWINLLFVQLNPFIQAVNQVLSQNVDFAANIRSVSQSYDQTYVAFQPFSFQWKYPDFPPVDLRVTRAAKGSTLTPTILLAAWEYDATEGVINVSRMVEVTSGLELASLSGRYQFTIRVTV